MSEKYLKPQTSSEDKQREYDLQRYQKELKMLKRDSDSWTDIKILSYLVVYKIAREDDLISYAVQVLNKPASYVIQALTRMVKEKKIKQIIHFKIEPQKTYYEGPPLGVGIDYDLWLLAGIDSDGNIEEYRKVIKDELRKDKL